MKSKIAIITAAAAAGLLAACLHPADTARAQGAEVPTPAASAFVPLNASAAQYQLELEKAAAKRTVAQDRCFGMVGAAKNVCLSEAEELYAALVRLADARRSSTELAASTVKP